MTVGLETEIARHSTSGTASLTTPAGLDTIARLNRRRVAVLTLNVVTWCLLLVWAGSILATGGWGVVDIVLFVCAAVGSPWAVLGFWNALIGLWQLHVARGAHATFAGPENQSASDPIIVKTAVLMTLRNEEPRRALARLEIIKNSLDAQADADKFTFFVLSDTDAEDVARLEELEVAAWRARTSDADRVHYRRRQSNEGFKAGNIRDFCLRWGADYELMLPLDADSLMTADAIRRLVVLMQRHPRLGILQSLVVGTPSTSPFARIFQFGMRLGMRTYTMGQAWWVGDCGPYWGHNALVRVKPFTEHCNLPVLRGTAPLGGPILSHDQVEATLMRRAGFEVRVLPVEIGSFEDNPPDALEFTKRDVRWCQGNMQYLRLIKMPGLFAVSRFQLIWATFMFLGVPAWTLMIALLPALAGDALLLPGFSSTSAKALFVTFMLMHLTPKLAGLLDAALTPGEMQRFGGPLRMTASATIEIVFSFLIGSISGLRVTIFMLGLPFGKSVVWTGQSRETAQIGWSDALRALWPHLAFGLFVTMALLLVSPNVLMWSLPLTAGYLVAIPLTVLTSSPRLGARMARWRLASIPEEQSPPSELSLLQRSGVLTK